MPKRMNQFERNILKVYRSAEPQHLEYGHKWYRVQHDCCIVIAERYHTTIETVCGVAAAISPGLRWERNLYWAEQLIRYPGEKDIKVPTYNWANVEKAYRIISGADPERALSGPKVTAFYRLLLDPCNDRDVCVDGHAYNIATGQDKCIRKNPDNVRETIKVSRPVLREVTQAYVGAAKRLRMHPHQLQAVTWLVWRDKTGKE